ncbi:hemolysin family protein [bacterium]|nr:hemolysin family protein [bacterium]
MIVFLISLAILVCLGLSFFFSGAEVAVISVNRYRLRSLHEQGDATAGHLLQLLSDTQRLLVMVLIGTNLANVLTALFFKDLVGRWLGERDTLYFGTIQLSDLLSLAVLTPLMIILAEVLPKALFRAHADRLFGRLHIPLHVGLFIFAPAIAVIQKLAHWMLAPLVEQRTRAMRQLSRKDVINLVAGEEHPIHPAHEAARHARGSALGAAIETELGAREDRLGEGAVERRMIQNIIMLHETRAYEIMTPLAELVAVQLGRTDIEGFKILARNSGYSRLPVYRDRFTRLIGYIDVNRVVREENDARSLGDFIEPPYFVPETKRIDDLLMEFLGQRVKNAIVVDEYGGCVGWISREDILEEIVGELEDELDIPQRQVTELAGGAYLVEGRTEIDVLNDRLGAEFPQDDWETLAGLLLYQMGRIPKVGDEVTFHGWRAHIVRMDDVRIDLVRMTRE